jgi:hypothetical protein
LRFALKLILLGAVVPMALMAETDDFWAASDRCPESEARICYGYEDHYCISAFYHRGDPEFAGETVLGILDNIAIQAKARRPSRIEITSHYMKGADSESKMLAKQRAANVVAALIDRGISSKLIKLKSPKQQCVGRDDQVKQRRVEIVFIPEKKRK